MDQQQITQPTEGGIIFQCKNSCPRIQAFAEAGAIVPHGVTDVEVADKAARNIGMERATGVINSCAYPEHNGANAASGWCYLKNERAG